MLRGTVQMTLCKRIVSGALSHLLTLGPHTRIPSKKVSCFLQGGRTNDMKHEAALPQDVVGFGLWLGGLEEGAVVSSRLGVSGGRATLQ